MTEDMTDKHTLSLTLPKWYDLHAHFRQGDALISALLKDHAAMGCAGLLAMPNTKPPLAKVHDNDDGDCWSIEGYKTQLIELSNGAFDTNSVIVPLYLTQNTTPEMIEAGAKSGWLKACKYYPPHGTTGAQDGAALNTYMNNGVFKAMQDHGIVLCLHGEEHSMEPEAYFDRAGNAEEFFYRERMPKLLEAFPTLKLACEHITTRVACDFVSSAPDHVVATITPQHLLYTVGHLLKGFHYHLYCLPLLKHEEDRAALRAAATNPSNTKFFAGTDSAPHTSKVTPCGCAAGCYTGAIAPQLYAQGFEEAGCDLSSGDGQRAFQSFLCDNGPAFYRLKPSEETFVLQKSPQKITALDIDGQQSIIPLPLGLHNEDTPCTMPWRIQS
jgi:dihydroorotase